MSVPKRIAAFAIEDSVDFWTDDGTTNYMISGEIAEGSDYFLTVRGLLIACLDSVIKQKFTGQAYEFFESIEKFVISTPGVVIGRRMAIQLPLWNFPTSKPVITWDKGTKRGFDFAAELANIANEIIQSDGGRTTLDPKIFADKVLVVNDATACAAFEYYRRVQRTSAEETPGEDFIYIKVHNGINVGVVEKRDDEFFEIRTVHAESGHVFPIPHQLDFDAQFEGACTFHERCLEGMVAGHSMLLRAHKGGKLFKAWTDGFTALKQNQTIKSKCADSKQPNQYLDNLFIHALLGSKESHGLKIDCIPLRAVQEATDLVAHYLAQIVHQFSIGPLAPTQIVIGGRMAKTRIIDAVREKVVAWADGYPLRLAPDSSFEWTDGNALLVSLESSPLTNGGIKRHIVRMEHNRSFNKEIEINGAWAIAKSSRLRDEGADEKRRRSWRGRPEKSWGGTRVRLPLTFDEQTPQERGEIIQLDLKNRQKRTS